MSFPTPPLSNSKPDLDQAWHRLVAFLQNGGAGTDWSKILFVDQVNGSDATAERGSFTKKYATIQAALDAAQTGDTVWVSPGTYVQTVPLVWPAAPIDRVTLRGFGRNDTFILGAQISVGAVTHFQIRDIGIMNIGFNAIVMDGSAAATSYNGVELSDLYLIGDVLVETANRIDIHNVRGSDIQFVATGPVFIDSCQFGDITVNYPVTPTMAPASGRGPVTATSSLFSDLVVDELGWAVMGKDTQVQNVTASILDTDALACGSVWSSGKIAGDITINFTLTNVADGTEIGRFDYAEIAGQVGCTDDGLGGTQRARINFRHASLYDTTGPHLFGDLVDADLREALFSQTSIGVGATSGTVDRTNWHVLEPQGNGAAGFAVTIDPPYPGITSDYTVIPSELSETADGPIAVTAKAATSFTRTKTDDTGYVQYLLVRPYD